MTLTFEAVTQVRRTYLHFVTRIYNFFVHFFSLIQIIPDLSEKKLKSNLKKVLFTDFLCIDVNKQLCYTVLAYIIYKIGGA